MGKDEKKNFYILPNISFYFIFWSYGMFILLALTLSVGLVTSQATWARLEKSSVRAQLVS